MLDLGCGITLSYWQAICIYLVLTCLIQYLILLYVHSDLADGVVIEGQYILYGLMLLLSPIIVPFEIFFVLWYTLVYTIGYMVFWTFRRK